MNSISLIHLERWTPLRVRVQHVTGELGDVWTVRDWGFQARLPSGKDAIFATFRSAVRYIVDAYDAKGD